MVGTTRVDQFPTRQLAHLASIDFFARLRTQARRDRADAMLVGGPIASFHAPEDSTSIEPALRHSFGNEFVALDVLADDVRPRLAEASRLTDSLRHYDDLYHDG